MDLVFSEVSKAGLFRCGEVVRPVCDVEACEGAREHDAADDVNPLGPGVEVEPELGAEDGLDPLPASLPHDGRHQGREQNGLWRIFRSLL